MRDNTIITLLEQIMSLMSKCQWRCGIKLLKDNDSVKKDWELAWNLGWCYFKVHKLDKAEDNLKTAFRLTTDDAKQRSLCYWALGMVFIEHKLYRRAEKYLSKANKLKGSYLNRLALAATYLHQGKIEQAEKLHLLNIEKKPSDFRMYRSYSAFLSDIGREVESEQFIKKANKLKRERN